MAQVILCNKHSVCCFICTDLEKTFAFGKAWLGFGKQIQHRPRRHTTAEEYSAALAMLSRSGIVVRPFQNRLGLGFSKKAFPDPQVASLAAFEVVRAVHHRPGLRVKIG